MFRDDITINWLIVASFLAAVPVIFTLGLLLNHLFPHVRRMGPLLYWVVGAILIVSGVIVTANLHFNNEAVFFAALAFFLSSGAVLAWIFFSDHMVISSTKVGPTGVITKPISRPADRIEEGAVASKYPAPAYQPVSDKQERTANALRGIGRSSS